MKMNFRSVAEQIFLAGVDSVLPDKIIRHHISTNGSDLRIGPLKLSLSEINCIYLIGAGKASAFMAREVEVILDDRITGGIIIVKYGHGCELKNVKVAEAGHPEPDANGFKASEDILKIAGNANENDLVICLLSGGGSALLADCPDGCSAEDLIKVNNLLLRCGADIKEINAVRKHLSKIKGGQLAKAVWPATLVSLILSDVIDDPLDVIASGPTAPDTSTFKDALNIIGNYNLQKIVPDSVLKYLRGGERGKYPETLKVSDQVFNKTTNLIVGNNKTALDASLIRAVEYGFNAFIMSNKIQGNSVEAAEYIVRNALEYKKKRIAKKPGCLLFGGETTLEVKGNGLGGRNQHLALSAAEMIMNEPGITILSAGTDGTDGPTDAAGAVVDSNTFNKALSKKINPREYLRNFDSYNFFNHAGGHIVTGPTMTNVMDMVIAIVE